MRARGFALVIALAVLALTAVVALAAADQATLGLRAANAALDRARLFSATENALERVLAGGVPDATGSPVRHAAGGTIDIEVEVRRDRLAPLAPPPGGGYSLGIGAAGFVAEFYVGRSVGTDARGARSVLEQQFHVVVAGTP